MEKLYTQADMDEMEAHFRRREAETVRRMRLENAQRVQFLKAQNEALLQQVALFTAASWSPPPLTIECLENIEVSPDGYLVVKP